MNNTKNTRNGDSISHAALVSCARYRAGCTGLLLHAEFNVLLCLLQSIFDGNIHIAKQHTLA
jgi:hypothetical protein